MDKRPFERPTSAVRAFRDHYAAPFVGVSYDLAPRSIGIHPAVVGATPDLAGREVLVMRDRGARTPLHRRPSFRVVLLTGIMRNAMQVGAEGGVVFSPYDYDDPDTAPVLHDMDVGDVVYLNAALDRLPHAAIRRPFAIGHDDAEGVAS